MFGVDIMVIHLYCQGTVTATVGISISLTHLITIIIIIIIMVIFKCYFSRELIALS